MSSRGLIPAGLAQVCTSPVWVLKVIIHLKWGLHSWMEMVMVTSKHGLHWKARKPQRTLPGTSGSSGILWSKAWLAAHQSHGEEQRPQHLPQPVQNLPKPLQTLTQTPSNPHANLFKPLPKPAIEGRPKSDQGPFVSSETQLHPCSINWERITNSFHCQGNRLTLLAVFMY